jgi:hypothetical protein
VDGWASRGHNSITGHAGWRLVADLDLDLEMLRTPREAGKEKNQSDLPG